MRLGVPMRGRGAMVPRLNLTPVRRVRRVRRVPVPGAPVPPPMAALIVPRPMPAALAVLTGLPCIA
jgi:hypothetical protein